MFRRGKVQLFIGMAGILVSLGLGVGVVHSLTDGPSPMAGDWTMFLLIPFVVLNPIYPLSLLLFIPLSSGLKWLDLEWLGTIYWVVVVLGSLYWWWFVGGIVARAMRRQET